VVVAEAIAGDDEKFARLMTSKARALGMSRTVYRNASGLPDREQVTSARDQARLGRAIQDRFPRLYHYFATPAFAYRGHVMRNHNKLLGRVAGVDGIKTGYTYASGFNLVTSARRGPRHVVAVVLGGRSGGARDARMRELIASYIDKGAVRRTAAAIVEAEPRTAVAATPSKPAPVALPTPPARPVVEKADAGATPASPAASGETTATIAPVTVGSDAEIRPIAVKTVRVRASSLKSTAIGVTYSPAPSGEEPAAPAPRPADSDSVPLPRAQGSVESARPRPEPPSEPPRTTRSGWMIQVGAYEAVGEAKARLAAVQSKASGVLRRADPFTEKILKGEKTYYRARFAGFDKAAAEAACRHLKRSDITCFTARN
ncbi:MAG TPA: SPOR domain-containing protein, partial [Xanthobacteraceae bacterium]